MANLLLIFSLNLGGEIWPWYGLGFMFHGPLNMPLKCPYFTRICDMMVFENFKC